MDATRTSSRMPSETIKKLMADAASQGNGAVRDAEYYEARYKWNLMSWVESQARHCSVWATEADSLDEARIIARRAALALEWLRIRTENNTAIAA